MYKCEVKNIVVRLDSKDSIQLSKGLMSKIFSSYENELYIKKKNDDNTIHISKKTKDESVFISSELIEITTDNVSNESGLICSINKLLRLLDLEDKLSDVCVKYIVEFVGEEQDIKLNNHLFKFKKFLNVDMFNKDLQNLILLLNFEFGYFDNDNNIYTVKVAIAKDGYVLNIENHTNKIELLSKVMQFIKIEIFSKMRETFYILNIS